MGKEGGYGKEGLESFVGGHGRVSWEGGMGKGREGRGGEGKGSLGEGGLERRFGRGKWERGRGNRKGEVGKGARGIGYGEGFCFQGMSWSPELLTLGFGGSLGLGGSGVSWVLGGGLLVICVYKGGSMGFRGLGDGVLRVRVGWGWKIGGGRWKSGKRDKG